LVYCVKKSGNPELVIATASLLEDHGFGSRQGRSNPPSFVVVAFQNDLLPKSEPTCQEIAIMARIAVLTGETHP
jgi:hypothetical protein